MLTRDHYAVVDLSKPIQPETLNGVLALYDNQANKFRTKVCRGEQELSLAGCTVTGLYTDNDGEPWKINGVVKDGCAIVTLPMGCLAKAGRFTLAIKVGSNTQKTTVRIVRGHVLETAPADLWKNVRSITAMQTGPEQVTVTVTPYVDTGRYKVCRGNELLVQDVAQMSGTLSATFSQPEGLWSYCVVPMLENSRGEWEAGNKSMFIDVGVSSEHTPVAMLSVDAEGNGTITGAILTVDAEGNATLTGYTPSVDGDGDATVG